MKWPGIRLHLDFLFLFEAGAAFVRRSTFHRRGGFFGVWHLPYSMSALVVARCCGSERRPHRNSYCRRARTSYPTSVGSARTEHQISWELDWARV